MHGQPSTSYTRPCWQTRIRPQTEDRMFVDPHTSWGDWVVQCRGSSAGCMCLRIRTVRETFEMVERWYLTLRKYGKRCHQVVILALGPAHYLQWCTGYISCTLRQYNTSSVLLNLHKTVFVDRCSFDSAHGVLLISAFIAGHPFHSVFLENSENDSKLTDYIPEH